MSEFVKLEDTVRFGTVTYNQSGVPVAADTTPSWYVYEDATDTAILAGDFVQRTSLPGTYRGLFDASGVIGFESNKYYEIHASGMVNSISSKTIIKTFVVDDVFDANIVQISGSTQTLTNFGYTYDGTGYTDDDAPAKQSQLDTLTSVGAAINTPAIAYNLTTGTQLAGTYVSTSALDGVEHQHEDNGGTLELDYVFDVGSDGVPTSITAVGRSVGNNDDLTVYASGSTGWDQIGTFDGQAGATNQSRSYDLYTTHVGTGTDLGKVRIRFYDNGLSGADLYIDQTFVSYSVVNRSVGYANGSVWIDTVDGTAGTVSYTNGVADKPSLTLADAATIASNLNLKRFTVINGSTITLDATYTNYSWFGDGEWSLALNEQNIDGAFIQAARIEGSGSMSNGTTPSFDNCVFGNDVANIYLPVHNAVGCKVSNPNYAICIASGITVWDRCVSAVAGNETPTVEFGDQWVDFNCRHYMGGITYTNMQAGNRSSFDCPAGQIVLDSSCTGGDMRRAGFNRFRDNAGGAVTVTDGFGMTIDTDGYGHVVMSGVSSSLTQADVRTAVGLASANLDTQLVSISGDVTGLDGDAMRGTDSAALAATALSTSIWTGTKAGYIDVAVSSRASAADLVALSGDVANINPDIYFANIKYVSDYTNSQDEYAVQWFKNDEPVASGGLTTPALSVYNTATGTAVVSHKSMAFASPNLGVVRYNESTNIIASGEPYVVEASGTIDGSLRTWKSIIGTNILS